MLSCLVRLYFLTEQAAIFFVGLWKVDVLVRRDVFIEINPVLCDALSQSFSHRCSCCTFCYKVGLHNLCNLQRGFSEILWQFPVCVSGRIICSHRTHNCSVSSDTFVIVAVNLAKSAHVGTVF